MSGRVTSLYENGIGLDEWMKTKLKKKKKKTSQEFDGKREFLFFFLSKNRMYTN